MQIKGQQCTLVWHVDDMKISHVDSRVVDNISKTLEQEIGKEAPLTIRRGKIHDYPFTNLGKIAIRMDDYIRNMLTELPEDMEGMATTPAAEHLFKVNEAPTYLNEKEAMFFHHNMAKLLFQCK